MNEQRYKNEDLRYYKGILTSQVQNGGFKMELKIEDNLVLQERTKIESSIELEFIYNYTYSLQFFHNIHSCQIEDCSECEEVRKRYSRFETDISSLQLGDTFEIKAALINNRRSELPKEIGDIKKYEPLLVACPDYYNQGLLRLPDTIEGINKKQEYMEQNEKESQEKEEESQEKEEERERENTRKIWKNKVDRLNQHLKEYKPIYTLIFGFGTAGLLGLFLKYILPLFTKFILP